MMLYCSPPYTFLRLPSLSYSTSIHLSILITQSNRYHSVHLPHSQLDYEALCRYTVRMGRSFNSVVQEMRVTDEKTYALLKEGLKRDLLAMMDATNGCVSRLLSCIPIFVSVSFSLAIFCYSYHLLIFFLTYLLIYSPLLLIPLSSLLPLLCTFLHKPFLKLLEVLVLCTLNSPGL